jgi:archaemetzincin
MKKLSLLILVLLFACKSDQTNKYFDEIKTNDVALLAPEPGEWLYSHKEKGQTFEQFEDSKHIIPTEDANIIYVKPIGNFTELQNKQIELLREYLEIYFQLETKIGERVSDDIIPAHARRELTKDYEQLLAGYILDSVLKKEKPLNGIALMGLTEKDLYPKPDWSFVFGLASYSQKIGVSSIYRLQDEKLTEENFNLCLSRLLKICSHEIGHMFGLHHCIDANCVMNGTNSLPETDEHSIRLCSWCQKKLNAGINYNNKKRLSELANFFQRNNLIEELQLMKKDMVATR